jgi:signal transduction histidine kinase/DNA-binding NarL/FixJ family response regulator
MKAHLRSFFDRYRAHHDMDRPLLQWFGVLGCVAFPLFYLLRRAAGSPGFDDLGLRMVAAGLCLLVAMRGRWPAWAQRFYIGYSYLVVFYCLAFLLSYTMIRNEGGTPSVVNMVMGAVMIILLADWRNTIAMLLGGYGLALAVAWAADPGMTVPREFVYAAAGSLLIVVGGALSHQGQKRVELQRMRLLYASLAGSIAHEMRNPLAQVRHALDSIAAALPTVPPGQGAQLSAAQLAALLATVQQGRHAVTQGQQSIELTLQQLQPSKPDQGRLRTLSAFDSARSAADTFAYDDAGQRACVQVVEDEDFYFRGDPTAIELVLFNLLKNALFYLPIRPEMRVTITATCTPRPAIVVHDTGPGIAPALLPRLFQEFQTAGKQEGTGLGLAFCRRIMLGLGGDISCRSEPGQFTEFTLTLPRAAPGASAVKDAGRLATGMPDRFRGRTLLVVDDQALNRAIARSLASELGLDVTEADHGQKALDLLQSGARPDAILMDVNMPGLNGIETARAIRALDGPAAVIPVVAVTANTAPAVLQASLAAGMQAVLGKPIDREMLARTLAAVLADKPAASVPAAVDAAPVDTLNHRRLQDFQRLGFLDEMVPGALRDLHRLVDELQRCVAKADAEGTRDALHTLVGLSGEAGARILHQVARKHYESLLEQRQPEGSGWIREIDAQLDAAEQQLLRDYGVRAAPGPDGPQTSSHSLRV